MRRSGVRIFSPAPSKELATPGNCWVWQVFKVNDQRPCEGPAGRVWSIPVTQFPTKATLTDAAIEVLPLVLKGRACVRDAKLSQLMLMVGPRSKTFYLHATLHRRTHRVRLGPWPIVGVDEARDQCLATLRRLYRGEPVKAVKPTTAPTLATVLTEYLAARKLSTKASADLRSVIGVRGGAAKPNTAISGNSATTTRA